MGDRGGGGGGGTGGGIGPKTCLFCGVVLTGKWKRCGGCRAEYF